VAAGKVLHLDLGQFLTKETRQMKPALGTRRHPLVPPREACQHLDRVLRPAARAAMRALPAIPGWSSEEHSELRGACQKGASAWAHSKATANVVEVLACLPPGQESLEGVCCHVAAAGAGNGDPKGNTRRGSVGQSTSSRRHNGAR
jgi:hypothetical protein